MNINVTLFGQMITFAIFVWFTLRYVWPLLEQAMDERQKVIAKGLEAANLNQQILADSKLAIKKNLQDAEQKSVQILTEANLERDMIIENAKRQAIKERDILLASGEAKLLKEQGRVREELKNELVAIALAGAEKLIKRQLNAGDKTALFEQLDNH